MLTNAQAFRVGPSGSELILCVRLGEQFGQRPASGGPSPSTIQPSPLPANLKHKIATFVRAAKRQLEKISPAAWRRPSVRRLPGRRSGSAVALRRIGQPLAIRLGTELGFALVQSDPTQRVKGSEKG